MDNDTDRITVKDKINILLKEYDTLRAEIIARANGGYQLIAIGAGVLALSIQHQGGAVFWVLFSSAALVLFVCAYALFRDSRMCAERVRRIEAQINMLAGGDLLEWETLWGGTAQGHFRKHLPQKSN